MNPNGRPKKLPSLDKLLAEVLGGEQGEEATAILMALLKKAKAGDVKAAEVLFDRAYGKAKQDINQSTVIKDDRIDESKISTDDLRVLADIQRRSRTSTEEPS